MTALDVSRYDNGRGRTGTVLRADVPGDPSIWIRDPFSIPGLPDPTSELEFALPEFSRMSIEEARAFRDLIDKAIEVAAALTPVA